MGASVRNREKKKREGHAAKQAHIKHSHTCPRLGLELSWSTFSMLLRLRSMNFEWNLGMIFDIWKQVKMNYSDKNLLEDS